MRILQVHTKYREPGGEDAVVEFERQLLTAAGHEVEQLQFQNPVDRMAAASALARAPWNAKEASSVAQAARTVSADVVHVHNTWFALSPAVFASVSDLGIPTLATVHNYRLSCVNAIHYRNDQICEDCVGRSVWRGVVHRCYRDSFAQSGVAAVTIATHRARNTWDRDVDVVLCLTEFAAQRLTTAAVPAASILVKPNSVPDAGVRMDPPSSSQTILFVGRLSPEKGIENLLRAWATLDAASPLRLVVVGDGPMRDYVVSAAETLRDVDFMGRLPAPEVTDLMKASRALVFPSLWFEGMPMVLLEAMSAGLPSVVPTQGALPEIVGPGGITFRSGSVSDLADQIESVGSDLLVDTLGLAARRQYEGRYSPAAGLAALERAYELAIERRRRR